MTLLKNKRLNNQFFRYFFASLAALILDICIVFIVKTVLGLPAILALSLGFMAGLTLVYVISIKYVFGHSKYAKSTEIFLFSLIGIVGLVINDIIALSLMAVFGLAVAKAIAVLVVFIWNYTARKKLMTQKTFSYEEA